MFEQVIAWPHIASPKREDATSLAGLRPGMNAQVVAVNGACATARRLMEMGLIPGTPVHVVRTAPLGDPMQVRVRNYHLALRRNEAQMVTVTNVENR